MSVRGTSSSSAGAFVDKTQLQKLKLRAMRAGVWFRALRRIDIVLIDLTIRVTSTVRSVLLARSVLSVTRRLEGLLESRLTRAVREIGFSLACKLSQLAQRWGNRNARKWISDMGFVRYLAIMHLDPRPS